MMAPRRARSASGDEGGTRYVCSLNGSMSAVIGLIFSCVGNAGVLGAIGAKALDAGAAIEAGVLAKGPQRPAAARATQGVDIDRLLAHGRFADLRVRHPFLAAAMLTDNGRRGRFVISYFRFGRSRPLIRLCFMRNTFTHEGFH